MADENVLIPVPLATYRYIVDLLADATHPLHSYNEVNKIIQAMVRRLPENMNQNKDPNAS